MSNIEATLFNTLKDLASVTKVNLVQNLQTAAAAGNLTLDETSMHTITTIFSSTVDANVDVAHGQLMRVIGTSKNTTKKKSTK